MMSDTPVSRSESTPEPTALTGKQTPQPTTIGRYIVLDLIGVGGMGMVCTAYDPKLERKVALKLLRRHAPTVDSSRVTAGQARLFREAQALAKLSHPHVITVHDVDTHDGQLFIAMEYVEGKSLKEWMAGGRHPWKEVLRVFIAAGRGLAAAHAAGLVHRDFKPGNVILGDDGRVRVLDFGLVKGDNLRGDDSVEPISTDEGWEPPERGILAMVQSASDLTLTQAGRTVGTPAYMAPEQHLGLPVGPPADQFSFCLALYEALYGQLPFSGFTPEEQFRNVIEGNVCEPPRAAGVPPVPAWIHRILLRGLHPQPKERFPSMEALLAELENDPARRRRRWLLAAAAVTVLAGFVGGGFYLEQARSAVCSDASERLAGIWDDSRREAVRGTFLGTHKSFAKDAWDRIEEALDEHARSWVRTHTEVCRATRIHGDQSEVLLDVRMACLKRRQQDLRAMTDVFMVADTSVIQEAVAAVERLEDPTTCATVEQPLEANRLPSDPEERAAVEGVQNLISQAKALELAGRYQDALEKAQEAVARAPTVKHAPTHAEAVLVLAVQQDRVGEPTTAEATFRDAIELAAKARQGQLEATAWIMLIYVIGNRQQRFEDGLDMVLPAKAAVERVGGDVTLRAGLANNMAAIHSGRGEYEDAEREYREAIGLLEAALGSDNPQVLSIRNNLGTALVSRKRFKDAREELMGALAGTQRTLGPRHPNAASLHNNIGNMMLRLDEPARAIYHFERALEIRVEALGEAHPAVADSWFSLSMARRAQGETEKALEAAQKAIEIGTRLDEPPPTLRLAYLNLARLLVQKKRYEQALDQQRRAVQVSERLSGTGSAQHTQDLLQLCAAELDHGDPQTAVEVCRKALELRRSTPTSDRDLAAAEGQVARALEVAGDSEGAIDHYETAITLGKAHPDENLGMWQFGLARSLWSRKRRAAAQSAAREALATFRDMKRQSDAAEVTAWLATVR